MRRAAECACHLQHVKAAPSLELGEEEATHPHGGIPPNGEVAFTGTFLAASTGPNLVTSHRSLIPAKAAAQPVSKKIHEVRNYAFVHGAHASERDSSAEGGHLEGQHH